MVKSKFKECKILITFFSIVIILYYLQIPIPCLFHKITNLYCPGCGVTRMIDSLLHFHIAQAFSYNALVFILIILVFIYFLINIICYIVLKKTFKIPNYVFNILVVLSIGFAIIRNIPYFSYLAP